MKIEQQIIAKYKELVDLFEPYIVGLSFDDWFHRKRIYDDLAVLRAQFKEQEEKDEDDKFVDLYLNE